MPIGEGFLRVLQSSPETQVRMMAGAVGLFASLSLLRSVQSHWNPKPDAARYLLAAEPLAQGNGYQTPVTGSRPTQFSTRKEPWRYARSIPDQTEELCDDTNDPLEARNLAAQNSQMLILLRGEMQNFFKSVPVVNAPESAKPDPEEEELKALGYVN